MKRQVPGIFGANLLSQVPEFKKLMTEDKKRTGFAKVAGSCNVWVPPFSEADVLVTGPQWGCSAVVEPLSVPICGNLSVASTLVNTSRACFVVKVADQTAKDIWLKPRTRLGIVRECDVLQQGEPLLFFQESNSVTVSCGLSADPRKPPKREAEDMARWQGSQELPTGITVVCFPGTEQQRETALQIIRNYRDVFAKDSDDMGCTSTTYQRIHTEDDVPVMERHRRIPPNQYQEVKQHLQDLLRRQVIKPNKSDYASPIVLVRKKSGAIRLCVDYRKLNGKTQRDAYPLPRVEESLDALRGARFFSTIDLASAYKWGWTPECLSASRTRLQRSKD
ncbi:uncharacterized protein LOC116614299 [Nematostella vectensis]|uniref:uncharacterized protein LOC116614299 n=1 Tax=Nematostella vectensis TaxID=45351 RepID=UPI00139011CC|nr:uncharacterized protein LOC116614299 [Nematostella vectensis]